MAEKEIAVGPLEIEGIGQGAADQPVLEDRPPNVHDEALHAGRPLVWHGDLFQPTRAHRRDVVIQGPGLGLVFFAEVDEPRFQG